MRNVAVAAAAAVRPVVEEAAAVRPAVAVASGRPEGAVAVVVQP
jgi:hypothetical protein